MAGNDAYIAAPTIKSVERRYAKMTFGLIKIFLIRFSLRQSVMSWIRESRKQPLKKLSVA
jgi:hypothetical protein